MLTDERHSSILKIIRNNGIVKTQDLIDALNCSESTIRRDLDHLEKAGELKRIHGGAKRIYQLDEELSIKEKSLKNIQEKSSIGELAASLIEPNDVIFLDSGTTTLAMIEFLKEGNITVVTNGIQHASLLIDQNIHTYLIGGRIKQATKAIVGPTSLQELRSYRFNKAFIGINGIDIEYGCTTPDPEEAAVKKLAHLHASQTYALADNSKWNKVNFAKVCEIEDLAIITNEANVDITQYKEKTTILEANK